MKKVKLWVNVTPNSKIESISFTIDYELRIKIKAQPLEGKANNALIKYLSEFFDIAKSDIIILKGHTTKRKLVQISLSSEKITKLPTKYLDECHLRWEN